MEVWGLWCQDEWPKEKAKQSWAHVRFCLVRYVIGCLGKGINSLSRTPGILKLSRHDLFFFNWFFLYPLGCQNPLSIFKGIGAPRFARERLRHRSVRSLRRQSREHWGLGHMQIYKSHKPPNPEALWTGVMLQAKWTQIRTRLFSDTLIEIS